MHGTCIKIEIKQLTYCVCTHRLYYRNLLITVHFPVFQLISKYFLWSSRKNSLSSIYRLVPACTVCSNALIFVVVFSLFLELTQNILFTILKCYDDSEGFHVDKNRGVFIVLFICLACGTCDVRQNQFKTSNLWAESLKERRAFSERNLITPHSKSIVSPPYP